MGRSIGDDVRAVLVSDDPAEAERVREAWEVAIPDVQLVVVESPYRALTGPFIAYLDVLDQAWPPDKEAPLTFVIIPEYVARRWWERILYNQSTNPLRAALIGRPEHGRHAGPVPARGPRHRCGDPSSRPIRAEAGGIVSGQ